MTAFEIAYRPMAPGWVIGVGAGLLLLLILFFLVRRPRERWAWLVRGLMVLALVGILVRPGYGEVPSQAKTTDLEILVVVDKTLSMSALDYQGDKPRLDGVKADLKAMTKEFPGAKFSLMTFGRFTRTDLPFSSDTGAFNAAVETIRREDVYDGTGSLISAPVEKMTEVLTKASERNPDRKRLVVFVSDGENTVEGEEQGSFAGLDEVVDGGLVMGYGTEAGGKMLAYEDGDSYVTDYSSDDYSDALSKYDEGNLTTAASEMGVDYQHRQEAGGLETWADDVDKKLADDGDDTITTKHEVYWIFALVLFGLALIELAIGWRGFNTARRELKGL